jgi:hypothetical protein
MFCGACVVAGLTQLETKPFPAGIFLGLLIFKPQAGLLAPVTALARWRFRAIAGGLVCAACVLVTVALVLGFQVWTQYFRLSPAAARQIAAAAVPIGSERGVSVMWMMRSLGAGAAAALAVQAVCAMVALGSMVFVWRREALGVVERAALTVFLSLLAVPYGFVGDMVAYSIMQTWLTQRRGWRIGLLDALLWLWPALCPIVYRATGVLLTPAVVALAALSVGRRQDLLF